MDLIAKRSIPTISPFQCPPWWSRREHQELSGSDANRLTRGSEKAQEQIFDSSRSSRQKYVALVVGRTGLAALLQYELIVTLTQSCPGALGLGLRKTFYPLLLGSCGRNVVFGQNVVLRHPHKIHIGNDVVVDDNCLAGRQGRVEPRHPDRRRRVHWPQHDSLVQERRYRAGRPRQYRLQLRALFRQPRHDRQPARSWPPIRMSSAAIMIFRIRRNRCSTRRGPRPASRSDLVRGWARARRFSMGSRSAITPSSARGRSCGPMCRPTRSRSAFPRASSSSRTE